ncbi:MAG: gamma-glutamylcyclotransferase [Chloroherpetonaceae bacterium]|nr:gamma-glutamylcyclotransferase [Chloroherpetonaceae bacterium]MDW8436834.1 gamma-glutamylcyclotransferase family protein [Chloroherpetonaceae bacterium]
MNPYLFVYGTLRKGARGGRFMIERSEHVGEGKIEAKLYQVSWYPAAIRATGSYVVGDVFRLRNPEETLKRLDEYEDAPNLYVREEIKVEMNDGRKLKAWVYLFNQPVEPHLEIPSGDFLRR